MKNKTKILLAAIEIYPYVKRGGLADSIYGLSNALFEKNIDLKLILPGFKGIVNEVTQEKIVLDEQTEFYHNKRVTFQVIYGHLQHIKSGCYVIKSNLFEAIENPYDLPESLQDFAVFSFFCKKIAYFIGSLKNKNSIDIVHCHDWHTALIPVYLNQYKISVKTILTIHNILYQGIFNANVFPTLDLEKDYYSVDKMEFYGQLNFLKAGIVYAHHITTVSPQYAYEILTPEFGAGLDGVLRSKVHQPIGVLNGVDDTVWNPEIDVHAAQNYSVETLGAKERNKIYLLNKLNYSSEEINNCSVAVISRLCSEKGIDLIFKYASYFNEEKINLIMLLSKNKNYSDKIAQIKLNYKNIRIIEEFDEKLAHQIILGSDLVMIPSYTEPCGLVQMYAMKYGTLPYVRNIGGLHDTVSDYFLQSPESATGFSFKSDDEFLDKLVKIVFLYNTHQERWRKIQKKAMKTTFSWNDAAAFYANFYTKILE
ncbi:glycogen synthase [Legionella worsleiensis]|uniref:Glycogen synthase n=1 Tax=Legionella worsleiensis TaxID=45076 RepID=A0A0W1AFX3_9GAMM|nr:glycogen/starch synthase [Legionella worsleiensis]KTD80226.1 Glycogen synthase [Legionella worsleiensis]STY31693.1 Glycogen synthase [Legionella worsleiensis]